MNTSNRILEAHEKAAERLPRMGAAQLTGCWQSPRPDDRQHIPAR